MKTLELKPDEMRHLIYLLTKGAPDRLYHTSDTRGRRRITHSAIIERKLRRMLGDADTFETST